MYAKYSSLGARREPTQAPAPPSGGGEFLELKSVQQKQDLLSRYKLVVVDIYAEWCQPCKRIAPVYEEMGKEIMSKRDDILFVKENLDNAVSNGIMSVPYFQIFKQGKMIDNVIGGNMAELAAKVNAQLDAIDEAGNQQTGPNPFSKSAIRHGR